MGNTAFLMPGQGSQYVGMLGKLDAYPKAQQIISKVNGILGFDLVKLMKEGPIEELTQTENTQPALVACSAAWLEIAKEKGLSCQFALGHSLGEYSALYAAEAIDLETALRLVRRRGELMRDATSKIPGTMGAIIGLPAEKVKEICQEASKIGVCEMANFNSSGQIVVSGEVEAVKRAMELAKEAKARLARLLQVSAPFHSSMMDPVAELFAKDLQAANISDAKFPVVANVNAKPVQKTSEIRENLTKQINSPVLWEKSILQVVAMGVDNFVEVGAKNVLTGLNGQIVPNLTTSNTEAMF
ncbi:MAG TPA: ACP S-malonyltransferase [Caldisericia bacterium]|nr:ACP S-malonyltransferase [Caldisericia bacterium]HOU08841.1 ACP S-malonyltransferase [Caldisericia bacterium]HQG58895.1 ACP S-malonyltransferase [Caldisericia bacterium]HQH48827.1 ACP S-malonyltransferase [Caldisericia bacterium]HQJ43594.1 ACP S-malonyltransferase [Caldisericia bacterium]